MSCAALLVLERLNSARRVPGWVGALLVSALTCASFAGPAAQDRSPAPTNSGVELFARHDFAGATLAFRRNLQRNSNDVEALIYLGRIAFEQNRVDEAAQFFERATVAAPKHSAAFHWLGRASGIQARDLGPPMGIGPARRTKRSLEAAVQLDPNNLEARLDLATYLREAPFLVGGSRKAALVQVDEIQRRDPYLGALARGDVALGDQRFADAEGLYQRAIQLAPEKTEGYYRLGVLHQKAHQYEKAFAAFEKMLQLDPNEKRALFQIGKTADLSGQRLARGKEALGEYLQCEPFFIMPKLSWAYRRLGNLLLKEGRPEDARAQYLAALKIAPGDKEAAAALKQLPAPAEGQ